MVAKQQALHVTPGNDGKWRVRRPSTSGMSGVMLGGVAGAALGGPPGALLGGLVGLAAGEALEHYIPSAPRTSEDAK
jgi:outer membrane lipoprotein SlyB